MGISPPPTGGSVLHPWLLSACDCHRDGTRVTAAYGLSYILLQDS